MLIIFRVAPFHGVLRSRVPWYNPMGREPIVHKIKWTSIELRTCWYNSISVDAQKVIHIRITSQLVIQLVSTEHVLFSTTKPSSLVQHTYISNCSTSFRATSAPPFFFLYLLWFSQIPTEYGVQDQQTSFWGQLSCTFVFQWDYFEIGLFLTIGGYELYSPIYMMLP